MIARASVISAASFGWCWRVTRSASHYLELTLDSRPQQGIAGVIGERFPPGEFDEQSPPMAVPTPTGGPRRGTQGQGAVGPPPVVAAISRLARDSSATAVMEAPQSTDGADVVAGWAESGGRRFVPPVERPSAGVAAKKGVSDPACGARMRPRAVHGSLTPLVSVSIMVTGAGLVQAQIVPAIGHRNGGRFPDGPTRPRVECAADSGTVRPTTLAAISRRSGVDFSGAT